MTHQNEESENDSGKDVPSPEKPEESEKKKNKKENKKPVSLMGNLESETVPPPTVGDIVEGSVIAIGQAALYVNLEPFGTGIIYGREFMNTRDVIKKINIGDSIAAKIVEEENEDGYIELSLKEARQALVWSEAEEIIKDKTILELPVSDANKGGLIIEWKGISGFLPASQLKTEHYPRVEDGDKNKILEELRRLIGEKIPVSIIGAFPKEGKLIFSEKRPEQKEKAKKIDRYDVGDEVEGEVTGMVDFGIFVKVESGLEGLVHISEIDWALVEDPKALFTVGDQVKVKIIEIKDEKISLSIKALKENPWKKGEKKYKKGDKVSGVIIKHNKYGALASIEEGIAGLVHFSDFGSEETLRETLELGKVYPFKINLFEPTHQKMTLSYIGKKEK